MLTYALTFAKGLQSIAMAFTNQSTSYSGPDVQLYHSILRKNSFQVLLWPLEIKHGQKYLLPYEALLPLKLNYTKNCASLLRTVCAL